MRIIRDKQVIYIIGALLIALVPNIPRLPIWVSIWCICLWGYIVLSSFGICAWPNKWFQYVLTGLGIVGIYIFFEGDAKGNTFLGLLVIMATLKPFEVRSYRDKMISLFIAYFIVITSLFESESLSVTLYMFISVFVTTSVMIQVNLPNDNIKKQLRLAGKIMLQSFPIMIVLFFLFPRVQGSLWGVTQKRKAVTGFKESMAPGDISRLVKNTETAFIVWFENEMPKQKDLYFRGVVLWTYDGKKWSPLESLQMRRFTPIGERVVKYSISLEPYGGKWLFALDFPIDNHGMGTLMEDQTLKFRRHLTRKIRYQVTSAIQMTTENVKNRQYNIALEIPETGNAKSRELAIKIRKQSKNTEDIIENGLRYFKENNFEYTLDPPELTGDIQDDFLFRSRKGYCEHFASAYAFLMRAAGVPSRVVVGYHGGQVNPYGGFLVVRQSEAHAWVEVFIADRGWKRVDPTAVVAPGRIERGLEGVFQPKEFSGFLKVQEMFSSIKFNLKLGWEALNSQWDSWFAGFSSVDQRRILEKLGIRVRSFMHQIRILLILIGGIAFICGTVLFFYFNRSIMPDDNVQKAYLKFCRKLEKVGIRKAPSQGPLDYAQHIAAVKSDLAPKAYQIINLYIKQRYAEEKMPNDLKELKSLVRHFLSR